MFAKIKIFGLVLAIDRAGIVAAPSLPNIKVKRWSAQVTQSTLLIDCWIEIAAKCSLRTLLRLKLETLQANSTTAVPTKVQDLDFPATTFILWDRLFDKVFTGAALTVKTGGLRYLSNTFPPNALTADSKGSLILVAPRLPLINDSGLPVGIYTGTGGMELDLAQQPASSSLPINAGVVLFHDKAFVQRTSYGLNVVAPGNFGTVIELFGNQATSAGIIAPLYSPATPIQLHFHPDSDEPMPLHVDIPKRADRLSASNPVRVPLALQNHILQFTMVAAGEQALLSALSARPKTNNDQFKLISYAYSNRNNQPALLYTHSELHLVARINEDVRPSSLLVRATHSEQNPLIASAGNDAALHGLVERSRFSLNDAINIHCAMDLPTTDQVPASLDLRIVRELTLPYFKSIAGGSTSLTVARSGNAWSSYRPGGPTIGSVQNLSFGKAAIALPFLPPELLQSNFPSQAKKHYGELENFASGLAAELPDVAHETQLLESSRPFGAPQAGALPNVALSQFLVPQLGATTTSMPPELAKYTVWRNFGPISLQLDFPPGYNPDSFVITPDKLTAITSFQNFKLVPESDLFTTNAGDQYKLPQQLKNLPIGIAKFTSTRSLKDILEEKGYGSIEPVLGKGTITDLLHPSLIQPGWVGLILFQVPHLASKSQTAGTIIPDGVPGITYLAITPQKQGAANAFSTTARLIWQNQDARPQPALADPQETLYRLNELDIVWYDGKLVSFYANAMLQVGGFFGIQKEHGTVPITIIGSYDQTTGKISFLGRIPNPLPLLPENPGFGPIRQVFISSASITMVGGSITIQLDGSISLQSEALAGGLFKTDNGRQIQFSGLGITIGDPSLMNWQGLEIGYPSIKLNFDLPPFNLGFLAVKMNSLWVDWQKQFNFRSIVPLALPPDTFSGHNFIFDLSLDLMKLPELAMVGLDRLNLDFYIGLGLDGVPRRWTKENVSVGLRALAFDHLNLNLMRFLEISANSVAIETVKATDSAGTTTDVACLTLKNVKIKILGLTIVEKLTAYLFSQPDGQACFALFSANKVTVGPIGIRWIMIGNNVSLSPDLAVKLMEIGASAEQEDADLIRAINVADNAKTFSPGTAVNQGRWIFAAAFSFAGLLDGKFLFQDHAYYGIALEGKIFRDWFGWDFAISVLYIRGRDPSQDTFAISLRVPQVTLPAFQFMGGELALSLAMNGSFILDVGFPHLNTDGGRQWYRALGAIVTPFQGSGGFYIQKYTVTTAVAKQDALLLSAGYALQIGLGGSFGGGVFTAWVTAGIYFVVEGAVYLESGNISALRLAGAVGLVVRGGARLNFWIISVSIEIVLSAEARAVLIWGRMPDEYKLIGGGDAVPGGNKVSLRLDMTVYASASAEACIGGGWFRICKGISVTIPLRYSLTVELN